MQKLIIAAVIFLSTTFAMATEADDPVIKNFKLDKKNKSISYELTKPATIRIRVGSISGPQYKTLVNWENQKKGKHILRWDGKDTSGAFNILDNRKFTFSFNYYLPNENEPVMREYAGSDIILSDNFIGRVPVSSRISQNHKKHKKQHCRDIEVLFKVPDNMPRTKEGILKIQGMCPITVEFPDQYKTWFGQERFSINIFIDDVFVKGEAMGYVPYTWNFDTQGISKGKHLITVNLKGFKDHIGVGSLPFVVEPAASAPAKQEK
ncbi:MAG TPA: hypothetical protein PL155_04930 [Candidatus Omnitrophota bacterium]|nr:hypothetical protein [Candidatus Omnitrophota bacterium]HPD84177.1 hypothetical protein [Candidatus Omnitrophota bacterium]HRZ03034.1 hypothetical protein [Candidatus Omnitrophota bacterium]